MKKVEELFSNELYKDNLNSDSKILYGFLLDRLTLSQKHNWVNKNGNIYLIFTREEVKNKLGYSLKDYSDAIIEATQRHNIHLIDLFNELELDPYDTNLVPDGLHPNDAGHVIMADFIGKKLQEF